MSTNDDTLPWLADKEAIRELAASYCYRVAAKDVDGIIALFCEDCAMEVLGTTFEGADGLRKLYANALAVDPKPLLHNHVIERVDADRARGHCVLEIKRGAELEPGGGGRYEDHYVRVAGAWKFQRRVFHGY